MALEIPRLDDREFDEILADALKRIPVHSEEWTDHNPTDPGLTILEVLAWVAESDRYRLDRITPRHVEQYLRLLDTEREGPRSATARLSVDATEAHVGATVEEDDSLVTEDASGETHAFQATESVALTTASVGAVVADHRTGRTDGTTANETPGMYFLAFGPEAEEGDAMYLGFDGDPFDAGDVLDLAVSFHDDDLPEPATHGDEESTFEPSVEVDWQYCRNYDEWFLPDAWVDLAVETDETDRLYRGGRIRLQLPADAADDWPETSGRVLDRNDDRWWLRCVVSAADYEVPPQLDAIECNVVTARHRASVENEPLRRVGDGSLEAARHRETVQVETEAGVAGRDATTALPDQAFAFEHAPVLSATIGVGGEEWEPVDSFDASGPDDRHYVLDDSRGVVRFGDGEQGAIPAPGKAVVAERYEYGGGEAANVSPSASWRFERDDLADAPVAAPDGATGGRDAESVADALTRLQRDRGTPYRAVTPSDYEYVATHTPGLRFGRATAVLDHETFDDCETAKHVRVVVVPYSTRARPEPSTGFLEAVRTHLHRHRLLTDRVTVERPEYVPTSVSAEVGIESGRSPSERAAAVEDALDEFLHPLSGFEGDGWPFGRPIYLSELYEAIEAVDGVDRVLDVAVATRNDAGRDDDGNVEIGDTALCYPDAHDVTVRTNRDACGRDGQ